MVRLWAGLLLSAGMIQSGYTQVPMPSPDRVMTGAGLVEGLGSQASGVREFRGVPYANPPLGALRWAAPQALRRWSGVRQARQFGPRCMQQPVFSDMVFRSAGIAEDCLYLNIWTAAKSPAERLPVLVYFYGGGLIAGDSSEPRYDGENLARAGLVVLTVNYRLGVFGFFAHPELTRESHGQGSGNYGLLDQLAALRWVQANIEAFGGDPARVTIAGESAGSISVCAHMVSPLSKGLFARAIGESGSLIGTLRTVSLAASEKNGTLVAAQMGSKSLSELRALRADRLLELAGKAPARSTDVTVDGYFLPALPAQLLKAGVQAHIPLLVGSNTGEGQPGNLLGKAPPTVGGYRAVLKREFPGWDDEVFAHYPAASDGEAVLAAAQDLAGDTFIGYSTWAWLQLATTSGASPTYYYEFARARPAMSASGAAAAAAAAAKTAPDGAELPPRGAVHSGEIEYALGNLPGNGVYAWTDEDRLVSRTMREYFVNFVKSGDPNGAGLVRWPQFRTGMRMRIDIDSRAVPVTVTTRYRFLERYFAARQSAEGTK